MRQFFSRFAFTIILSIIFFASYSQQTVQKIITETRYLLYLPETYNTDTVKRWPLLLFLHGSGESGTDIEKVKAHGPPQLIEQGKKFPFIVASPQSDVPSGWDVDQLYKLLQQLKKNYRVDFDRVYMTGLSMGGFGTWAFAMKYPEEFAAIVPVCGGGDTSNAWKIRNIPVWNFHGALDVNVPIVRSENMVKAVSRFNSNVRFTIYPDKAHNSWDTTYNTNDSLYNWLLSKKKFRYTEIQLSNSVLKKYEGWYVGPDNDTVKIVAGKNSLVAFPGKDTVLLKPSAEDIFFFNPEKNMDIRFMSDKKGVFSFVFFGDRKLFYKPIAHAKK